MRSSHHGSARISSTQDSEMFQSSLNSWSSKIIVDGTVDEQPADVRIRPRLAVEPGVLLEVGDLPRPAARRCRGAPRMNAAVSGEHLVGVHLVAEQQQPVRPGARRPPGAAASRPRARRRRSPCGSSVGVQRVRRAAAARRPGTSRTRAAPGARPLGCGSPRTGRPSSGGQAAAPSRRTSYGVTDPGSRFSITTSA